MEHMEITLLKIHNVGKYLTKKEVKEDYKDFKILQERR